MRSVTSTITTKGQVTIPAEVRRHLGIGKHDRVVFVIDHDQVRLQPMAYTLETAFGSVTRATQTEDLEARIEEAKKERAQRTIAKLKQR